MRLYMKQKVFTWGDRFSIYNENGDVIYTVEGEVLTFGKKLHLFDLKENELAYIEQKVFTFLPTYTIYRDGETLAEVVKEFSFFSQKYNVSDLGWTVQGDFFDHDYEVLDRSECVVASVSKEWFTFGDAYEIDIDDGADVISALAVVLVIDACIEASQN